MKYLLLIVIFVVAINIYKLVTGGIVASRFPIAKIQGNATPGTSYSGSEISNYYYNPITHVVYYIPMGNWFELACDPLDNADFKSFKEVANLGYVGGLAKDAAHVYISSVPYGPDVIDGDSLEFIGYSENGPYVKDKNHVYSFTENVKGSGYHPTIVPGANPKTFVLPPKSHQQ